MAQTGDTNKNSQRKSAAQTALETVDDRQEKYGPPNENFDTIAELWTSYLKRKWGTIDLQLEAQDVALMMVLVKLSREAFSHQRDNIVDIIGFAECYDRL